MKEIVFKNLKKSILGSTLLLVFLFLIVMMTNSMNADFQHGIVSLFFSFTVSFFIAFTISEVKYNILLEIIISAMLSFGIVYSLNYVFSEYFFKDQHVSHSGSAIPSLSVFITILTYLFINHKFKRKKKVLKSIGFPLLKSLLFTIVIVVIYAVIFIITFDGSYLGSLDFMYQVLFFNGLGAFIISMLLFNYVYKNFERRKRIIYAYYILIIVFFLISCFFKYDRLGAMNIQNFLSYLLVRIPFVFMITLSIQISYIYELSRLEKEYLKQDKLAFQLSIQELKNQLSPHFLFNNINVLTSFIEENPKKAIKFSENLSSVYRHFLDQEKEDIVKLEDELKFAQVYLSLLYDRFEKGLKYDVVSIENTESYVVSTSLQQILENVIKHNIVHEDDPITVSVFKESDYLVITNNCNLKPRTEDSPAKGLENIQKRYAFFTERKVIIEKNEERFTVKLPLLKLVE